MHQSKRIINDYPQEYSELRLGLGSKYSRFRRFSGKGLFNHGIHGIHGKEIGIVWRLRHGWCTGIDAPGGWVRTSTNPDKATIR
jgi:hypothetical protein